MNELARDARDCARWNRLHPTKKARQGYLETQMRGRKGPVIMSTDYIRAYSEQLREYIWSRFVSLGTDGYGAQRYARKPAHFFRSESLPCGRGGVKGAQ